MPTYEYSLGTSHATLVNLESMSPSVFAPRHTPPVYSAPTQLGSLGVASLGYLKATWHWDFLTLAQYNKLRTYCTGLSADVYIKTKNASGTYSYYTAKMIWPQEEPERFAERVLDITIEFRNLQVYTP